MKIMCLENCDESIIQFAVIIAEYKNQWVLCKHKQRDTYEFAGGHREVGEDVEETAKRELYEETGAFEYNLEKVTAYCVELNNVWSYGMLYYADINSFSDLPDFEMEKIELFNELPTNWTYPDIQPFLFKYLSDYIKKQI